MRSDQIEALRQQQAALAQQLQAMLDTPEAERPKAPKELRAWLRDLETAQQALQQMEQLIARAEKPRRKASAQAAPAAAGGDEVLLARIPKSMGAEIRVTLQNWKGRRTIDIRCYAPIGGAEMRPTTKGLQVDVKRLPALLDALRKAQQHV